MRGVATSSAEAEHHHSRHRTLVHVLDSGDAETAVHQHMVCHGLHVHSHMGLRMARREEEEHMGHRIV
jgi:hypothetical protein